MTTRLDSAVATGRGDDGSTGLLFGGPRIAMDDPRTEAYGTIDEAVAALGLARAELVTKAQYGTLPPPLGGLGDLVLRIQRELFVVAAELATTPEAWDRLVDGRTRVSAAGSRPHTGAPPDGGAHKRRAVHASRAKLARGHHAPRRAGDDPCSPPRGSARLSSSRRSARPVAALLAAPLDRVRARAGPAV